VTVDLDDLNFYTYYTQTVDDSMSWVEFDFETGNLYAAHEVDTFGQNGGEGAVSRWTFDTDKQAFVQREVVPAKHAASCHLFLDKEHRLIFVANYGGGGLAAISLVGGDYALGEVVFQESFPDAGTFVVPDRQDASHVHAALGYDGRYVYFTDLGADKVYHYAIVLVDDDSGAYTLERLPAAETDIAPGSGPRHMAADEEAGLIYLANELRFEVSVFRVADTGDLELAATIDYATGQPQQPAEIALHPTLPVLYISDRQT